MNVAEIKSAIAQLPAKDFAAVVAWLQEFCPQAWDGQITDDLAAGRLDSLIAEANDEYGRGLARS